MSVKISIHRPTLTYIDQINRPELQVKPMKDTVLQSDDVSFDIVGVTGSIPVTPTIRYLKLINTIRAYRTTGQLPDIQRFGHCFAHSSGVHDMRDATGRQVTGSAIAGGALAGIAKGAVLSALCIGLPMYLWGDQIKPVFIAIVTWLGA